MDHLETIMMDFEFIKVPVCKNYDHALSQIFGDWHKFVKGTCLHGGIILDCHHPYTEYLAEPANPAEEESILAFFEKENRRLQGLRKLKRIYKRCAIAFAVISVILAMLLIFG